MKATHMILAALIIIIAGSCSNSKNFAAMSDSSSATSITDKKWKLIELFGKPVADTINGKEPYIILKKADSMYAAGGGCNALSGRFEFNAQTMRIKFTQGISTMMVCADMSVESGLKQVFIDADNYSLNDTIMTLNKARMAPLARFKVVQ